MKDFYKDGLNPKSILYVDMVTIQGDTKADDEKLEMKHNWRAII